MTEEQIATLIGRIVLNNEAQRLTMIAKITEQDKQIADLLGNQGDAQPEARVQNGKTETKEVRSGRVPSGS